MPAAPTTPPVADRAEQPAQHGCAGRAADNRQPNRSKRIERIDMVEQIRSSADAAARGAGSFSPSITRDDPVDAGGNPAGEIAGLEFRRDDLVDDAFGGDVGQRAFEAVADLDAQLAVVLGDDEQRAVVDLLAADLPGFRDAERKLLDGLARPSSARSAPRSGCPSAPRNPAGSASARRHRRGERAGLVDHPPGQRRHRDVGQGCEAQHSSSARRMALAAFIAVDRIRSTALLRGAAGVGLKSTFGAVEISFSFSTEKFGFSL